MDPNRPSPRVLFTQHYTTAPEEDTRVGGGEGGRERERERERDREREREGREREIGREQVRKGKKVNEKEEFKRK